MSRLPTPGGDSGNWGNILNDYLSQIHKSDGTLKDDSVTNAAIADDAVNATSIADGSITEALLAGAVQTKLNATGDWNTLSNKPAVIGAGADRAAARDAINANYMLNILDYGVVRGTASSQTAAIKAALDANPDAAFFFPLGNYRLDTTLTVSADNSLILAPGARIYAGAAMSIMINYDNGQTATDSLAADHGICGYGVLDGALLADKVLRVASVLRFSIEGLTILDGVHRGLVVDFYAAEVSVHNLRLANTTTTNANDNVGIEVNGNDCRFSQVGMRDWTIGVWDKGANTWSDIHPWIGETAQLTARYQNSVAFKIAGDSLFIAAYADTYRYNFQSAQTAPSYGVARLIGPRVFCASGNLTSGLAAAYPGVVFDLNDGGGAFIVSEGKFQGHPVTNHAFTSGTSKRLTVKNSLPASYISGFTGYNDYIRGVTLGTVSFIPTLFGSTTAGTPTYTLQSGQAVINDGIVSYQFKIKVTLDSLINGNLQIGGLPFPDGAGSTNVGQGSITYSTGGVQAGGVIGGNGSSGPLYVIPVMVDGGVVTLTDVAGSGAPVTSVTIDSVPLRGKAVEIWGQVDCTINYQSW
jgi:hypothetical protein